MNRYNNTERLGVIETDRIVTKHLGWIFREQPVVDVGLDGLIEEVIEGNPSGKFMAVQIKSGAGNFHITKSNLIHYVSHIHYNYWLNLEFPIILIAHIPETEKTYWQLICEDNFRKTKKKWKIEIPKTQEFNQKSKIRFTQIVSSKKQNNFIFDLFNGKVEADTLFDFAENTECIGDAVNCVLKIVEYLKDLKTKTNEFNAKLKKYISIGLSDKDPQVKATIKGFGKDLNVCSKRLESEVVLFL